MIVGSKRFQQAMFEMAASVNRAAGSGGGSGLRPNTVAGLTTSAGYVTGITNAAWKTVASVVMQTNRTGDALLFANFTWQRTAGTIVDTFFAQIQVNSDADWSTGLGLVDGGNYLENAPNDTNARAGFMLKGYLLPVGLNTINLKATVNGDTFQCQGTLTVAQTL